MKKVLVYILVGFFVLSAVSLDVSAAKKSSKLSKEAVQEMSDSIDNIKHAEIPIQCLLLLG